MKRFCKILAVILAALMLTTMATACKRSDEEEDWSFKDSAINTNTDPDDPNSPITNPDDPNNPLDPDNPNQPKDPNNPNNPKDPNNPNNPDNPNQPSDPSKPDPTIKYTSNNPLVAEGKEPNTKIAPSFDVDSTGFVKNNISIKDLKGKTLTLITAIYYSTFQYKGPNGELLNEWTWFDSMKDTYGLNLKYIKSRFDKSVQQSLTYMNAGKALDIIPTHVGGFPKFLNLSQPLDPYVNIQNLGNSPGVDEMTLNETKWGGTYRCISPIGCVNVLWYNQSMVEEFGLKDPHKTWQEGNWNWDTWKAFITSVPATTSDGKVLYAYLQCNSDSLYSWPLTNGLAPIQIDTQSSTPNLINNWLDSKSLAAWEFYSSAVKSVKFGGDFSNLYTDGTLMMADAVNLMNSWETQEYARNHKYNWVPFPKATTATGRDVAFNYGYTMMIPKKVKTQSNIPYAVKFMELWACRFTEAIFDYFATSSYIAFNYAQRKEYFEFVVSNTYFGVQMNEWDMLTGDNLKAINTWKQAQHDSRYNITTETSKVKNIVEQAIKDCLAYGN